MKESPYHVPVLLDAVLALLVHDPEGLYVDATVGGGGHAAGICRRLSGQGSLVCFDADTEALKEARRVLSAYGDRVRFLHANFRDIKRESAGIGIVRVAGVLMDLGVSSHQLDEPARGFSFRGDAPVDMRLDRDQSTDGSYVINEYPEERLAAVLREFGEEKFARRIARRIALARPIATTRTLSTVIESAVGSRFLTKTLARVFQAIRIEVNRELESLKAALGDCVEMLSPKGRLVVVSYHSLEDRIVKEFMRGESATSIPSGHKYIPDRERTPRIRLLTRKPVVPGVQEISENPRARSAKLRAAERVPGA